MVAGGRSIPRGCAAEFRATGSRADLPTQYERWIAGVHEALGGISADRMERRVDVNHLRFVPTASSDDVSARELGGKTVAGDSESWREIVSEYPRRAHLAYRDRGEEGDAFLGRAAVREVTPWNRRARLSSTALAPCLIW